MPRFRFETSTLSGRQLDAATRLALRRFPEVTIDSLGATDGVGAIAWVCRAPSRAHVDRWAAAAGLELRSLRPTDHSPPCGQDDDPYDGVGS